MALCSPICLQPDNICREGRGLTTIHLTSGRRRRRRRKRRRKSTANLAIEKWRYDKTNLYNPGINFLFKWRYVSMPKGHWYAPSSWYCTLPREERKGLLLFLFVKLSPGVQFATNRTWSTICYIHLYRAQSKIKIVVIRTLLSERRTLGNCCRLYGKHWEMSAMINFTKELPQNTAVIQSKYTEQYENYYVRMTVSYTIKSDSADNCSCEN